MAKRTSPHKADVVVLDGPTMFPDPAIVSKNDGINILNTTDQDVTIEDLDPVNSSDNTLKAKQRGIFKLPNGSTAKTGYIVTYHVVYSHLSTKQTKSKKRILTSPSLIIDD